MDSRPEISSLRHNIQSKCASLKSASQLIKDCPPDQLRKLVILMADETRDILRNLAALEKEIPSTPGPETP